MTRSVVFTNAHLFGSAALTNLEVRDGLIHAIGNAPADGAEVIDLHGAVILPGLVDAHAHVSGLGEALDTVSLNGTTSESEMIERIAAGEHSLSSGEWLIGRGWDQNDWPSREFPSAAALDARVAQRPVWMRRIDGHAGLANSAAMRAAGITAATPDPSGGKIVRDASGAPAGVFIDNAMELIEKVIPPPSKETLRRRISKALETIAANGLTGVHDAGSDDTTIAVFRELADEGRLPIRLYVMLRDDAKQIDEWFARGPLLSYRDRLTVRAVKMYADGALGSRGAALLAPYSDDASNTGLLVTDPAHIRDVAERARKAGFQVCTHAIGDRGTRVVLDAYEKAGVVPADRFRIEHLQVAAPEDFARLAAHGVIASMQPTHATSDMDWAERRLGGERIHGAYAWRTVLDNHAPLAFGSDFPIENVNPFFGLHAAVTRQDQSGNPAGGWYPDQRLTLAEAVAAFTSGAAYASFDEEKSGRLAPGMRADLTIVASLDAPLWKTRVLYTVVGGKIVYASR